MIVACHAGMAMGRVPFLRIVEERTDYLQQNNIDLFQELSGKLSIK